MINPVISKYINSLSKNISTQYRVPFNYLHAVPNIVATRNFLPTKINIDFINNVYKFLVERGYIIGRINLNKGYDYIGDQEDIRVYPSFLR